MASEEAEGWLSVKTTQCLRGLYSTECPTPRAGQEWDSPATGSLTVTELQQEQGRGGAVDSVVGWLWTLQATEGIGGGQGVARTQEVLSSHPPIGVDWVKAFWNGVPALNLVKSVEE